MIEKLTFAAGILYAHASEKTLKTTKAFTHGSLKFDQNTRMASFGKLPLVSLPVNYAMIHGASISLQLVAPNGILRPQTRSGVLRVAEDSPGVFRVPGMPRSPPKYSAEDGWMTEVFKFRAYFSHHGLVTSEQIPDWLTASVARQRVFWNRMSYLCREARRACSTVPPEKITALEQETILPAVATFNGSLTYPRLMMKYPTTSEFDQPQIEMLWKFAGELRKRIKARRPVPVGLLDKVVAFAEQYKPDYTAINTFLSRLRDIGKKEADKLGLHYFEVRPQLDRFQALVKARRTRNLTFTDGWPRIQYGDHHRNRDWTLTYYFNRSGVKSEWLEGGGKVPGISFGLPKKPSDTGHDNMLGVRANRRLREVHILIPCKDKQRREFRFGILQHRALPDHSHIKQWQLAFSGGSLWLCLTVERQRPVTVGGVPGARLDIGWRRIEHRIRFGVLYEPKSQSYRECNLDLKQSPSDHKLRTPFTIDLGPSRWEKRNITQLIPQWKHGEALPSILELRCGLSARRNDLRDEAKAQLRRQLGDKIPPWFDSAGINGLLHLAEELKGDSEATKTVATLTKQIGMFNELAVMYMDRSTKRLKYGQHQVAHDVCHFLQQRGINRLMVSANVVAQAKGNLDGGGSYALKRAKGDRQFAAPSMFVATLKSIARKYGIVIDDVRTGNCTRICDHCKYLYSSKAKVGFQCDMCNGSLRRDHHADGDSQQTEPSG